MSRRQPSYRLMLTLLVALALAAPTAMAASNPLSKLVFHVNDSTPDHQEAVLRNLQNLVTSTGPENLDVRVLLQGGGVSMLLLPQAQPRINGLEYANASPDFRARIDELRGHGVIFLVSGRTLAQHHIDFRHDLYGVHPRDVVANALSRLAELQDQGYTYIKP